jgi:large subunit ribosomal protein L31
MKPSIHPKYYTDTKVSCACGNSFVTGSTMPEIKVEICSACHPFYTGEEKVLDTAGRVEKFKTKRAKGEEEKKKVAETKKARAERERMKKKEKEITESKKSKEDKKKTA